MDFHYVAMDFGGHGLSSHYSPGLPYYQQNFVIEVQRVVAVTWGLALYSCTFPEMVDKLILLDRHFPLLLTEPTESENLLTYKRRMIEHTLQIEASQKPQRVLSPEEMLQGFLKNNSHVGEECARLLLQRGTTQVATGLVLSRDRRITLPEYSIDFISRDLLVPFIRKLQAHILVIKAMQGFYNVRRENDADKAALNLVKDILKSVLKEWFQYTEVPGNHYIHMNQPQHVAGIIGSFLKSSTPNQL
uniref:Serine hydrolase like 2 n=1 Tax=Panthera tigris altaica TaxID=74533 RepID=A0A8C9KEZ5_PANTA